jgi:hypothetical protein
VDIHCKYTHSKISNIPSIAAIRAAQLAFAWLHESSA